MRIALTGGIADGKSTVLGYIREAGFPTLDIDLVVRQLQSEPAYLDEVVEAFGESVRRDGELDRRALRARISADSGARRLLNRLTHGPVLRRTLEWADGQPGPCFVEIPLLIETCIQGRFDQVWVVAAGREEQRRRLAERLGNVDEADRLLATQLPTEVKAAFADVTQRTNSAFDTVRSTVTRTLEELGLKPG